MSKDKISILVPFKNEEHYLQQCLESILMQKQEYFDIEVILIDDNSIDLSPIIAQDFCEKRSSFFYYKNTGDGVVEALQFGLKKSTGNYIHRMDADDLMPKNKLKNLYDQFVNHPNSNIATGKVKYFREDQPLGEGFEKYESWLNGLVDHSSYYQEIYRECPVASANWLMLKKDLLAIGGFGKNYPEDYDLIFRAFQLNYIIAGSKEITHLWRDHPQRASRTSNLYRDNNFFELKLKWFLKIDFNPKLEILLYGAGKKGKSLAKLLISKGVKFRWFTNNVNKIGHDIYGVILESDVAIYNQKEAQILILISNPEERKMVKNKFQNNSLKESKDFFIFN